MCRRNHRPHLNHRVTPRLHTAEADNAAGWYHPDNGRHLKGLAGVIGTSHLSGLASTVLPPNLIPTGLGGASTAVGAVSNLRIARFRTRRASFCFRNLPERALSPFRAEILHYRPGRQ